jgi:hypothetical protein
VHRALGVLLDLSYLARNFVFSLAASIALSPAWLLFGAAPALADAALLFALLRSREASPNAARKTIGASRCFRGKLRAGGADVNPAC